MSKKRINKIGVNRLTAVELAKGIVQLLKRHPNKRFNAKQIQQKLNIKNSKDSIQAALEKLAAKAAIVAYGDAKYGMAAEAKAAVHHHRTTVGKVDMTRHGSAYIVCEDVAEDVYVSPKNLNGALDGDRVEVHFRHSEGRRSEGEVVKILERATEYFIGTLHLSHRFGFVVPDKGNMFTDIYVPLEDINQAKDGDKVVVKIEKWQTDKVKSPVGKITETLGKAGSSDIEMKSILIQNGFELSFSKAVLEESEAISENISTEEVLQRRDFRAITTFTIDPDNAKDFDDALSIRFLENGHCEVGVHIADVTHYLQPNTALDKEAFKRSTSVYLVDRVLPMLPEKLSNVLCSLRPNEDKLTFSAVFTFDRNHKMVSEWFGKTIIHSDRRFTYEEAQEILETGEGEFAFELKKLNEIAQKLRAIRFKNGSIDFDAPEVKFKLDASGFPISLYIKERKDSNLLIEDFMLLANQRVATYIGKPKDETTAPVPFVYRIHDLPDLAKVVDFVRFAQAMGYKINIQKPEDIGKAFNRLVEDAKEHEELQILQPLAIRTMAKAEYHTDNIGHYGLGFDYYTHFTSPIRRYSDVLVHRILAENLKTRFQVKKDELLQQCKHISAQERKAMDAERQSVKYKQVEYMTQHVGEVFTGVVSGFLDKGCFVELLENFCEGLVSFDTMDEFYLLDESRLFAIGRVSGHKIKMGDQLKVRIIGANLSKRAIDMELVRND